jgi:hypothetical protein
VNKLQIKKREDTNRPPEAATLKHLVTEEEKVRLNVAMPKSRRLALRAKALQEGKTVIEIINQLVDEYLRK